MSIDEKRSALASQKGINDGLIVDIKTKLKSIITKLGGKNTTLETQELDKFNDRETIISMFIPKKGEDYFDSRLANETAFASFAGEYMTTLKKLDEAITSKNSAEEKRLGEALENLSKAWTTTRTPEWRTNLKMNETNLQTQLLTIIDQTIEEIENFREYSSTLENKEGSDSVTERAATVLETVSEYKETLSTAYIADTEENHKLISEIRTKLSEVRQKLPGLATSHTVKKLLKETGALVQKTKTAAPTGKKLNPKHTVDPFVKGTYENLEEQKADELTAAVFILEQLNIKEELFREAEMRLGSTNKEIPEHPGVCDYESNDAYKKIGNEVVKLAKAAKDAQARKDVKTLNSLVLSIKKLQDQQARIKGALMMEHDKKLKAYDAAIAKAFKDSPFKKVCDQIRKIAETFTGENLVSYSVRAKIMVENVRIKGEPCDFSELFDAYINAYMTGDREVMDDVNAALYVIEQNYNLERKAKENEILMPEEVEDPITEYITEEEPMLTEEEMANILGGIVTEDPTEEPKKKETEGEETEGTVETVNTEADSLLADILGNL